MLVTIAVSGPLLMPLELLFLVEELEACRADCMFIGLVRCHSARSAEPSQADTAGVRRDSVDVRIRFESHYIRNLLSSFVSRGALVCRQCVGILESMIARDAAVSVAFQGDLLRISISHWRLIDELQRA